MMWPLDSFLGATFSRSPNHRVRPWRYAKFLHVVLGDFTHTRPPLLLGIEGGHGHATFQAGEVPFGVPVGGLQAADEPFAGFTKTVGDRPKRGCYDFGTSWWPWMDSNQRPRSYQGFGQKPTEIRPYQIRNARCAASLFGIGLRSLFASATRLLRIFGPARSYSLFRWAVWAQHLLPRVPL